MAAPGAAGAPISVAYKDEAPDREGSGRQPLGEVMQACPWRAWRNTQLPGPDKPRQRGGSPVARARVGFLQVSPLPELAEIVHSGRNS